MSLTYRTVLILLAACAWATADEPLDTPSLRLTDKCVANLSATGCKQRLSAAPPEKKGGAQPQ